MLDKTINQTHLIDDGLDGNLIDLRHLLCCSVNEYIYKLNENKSLINLISTIPFII